MKFDDIKIWGGILLVTIAGCIMGLGIYSKYSQGQPIGNTNQNNVVKNLVGSSADYKRVAQSYVFANTTSTDPTYDGGTVTQSVETKGADEMSLIVGGVGLVSTSTLFIRYQISNDDSDYFDVMTASTTDNTLRSAATSTYDTLPLTDSVLIGTASNTKSFIVKGVPKADYTRFILYGPALGHLNLGVQAWVQIFLSK